MSKLQELREKRRFTQEGLRNRLAVKGYWLDAPLLSKMENDKCLPTPQMAKLLCQILSCGILDIYQLEEITFPTDEQTKISPSEGLKDAKSRVERKVQFRHFELSLQVLTKENLALLGYKSQEEWFRAEIRRLEKAIEKKKAALAADTTKAAGEHSAREASVHP